MPNTYVTQVDLQDDKLVLTVQVDGIEYGYVEISGQVTQDKGAYAPFYSIQEVLNNVNNLTVEAYPQGDYKFNTSKDLTVATRVAAVWVTMLPGPSVTAKTTGTSTWKVGTPPIATELEPYDH